MNRTRVDDGTAPVAASRRWWTLDPAGAIGGLGAAVLSVTPSLLPRPAILQGLIAAVVFALGYVLGVALWSVIRRLLRRDGTRSLGTRRRWYVWAAGWLVAMLAISSLAVMWQNEVRGLVSMPPLAGSDIAGFLLGFLPVAVLLVLAGKGVRGVFSRLRRRTGALIATLLTACVTALVLTGITLAALAGVDRVYADRNALPERTVVEPASDFRSAGPGSSVAWQTLGRHGAAFVGGGPSAADIEAVTGRPASTPIRVYAGLESASTIQERADLVVDELERTGAFERAVLVVATPTGSGWLEPQTVDALEYLHGGDTAIAAIQYAYTPSWVSFVFDPDAPVTAARVLFDAVEERWSRLPEGRRPQLVVYGLSLGAHGGQAVFTGLEDLRARAQGALFVGSPNGSPLWRSLQAARDVGSPVWQPVLDAGRQVRWMSRAGDERLLTGPWLEPRVLYLQHATDPVTWLAPELLWAAPDWLADTQRSPDISPAMRWIPVITGLQVVADMLVGEAVPASYGHNYGDVVVTAWQQITPDAGLDAAAIGRIQSEIEGYAAIPRHEE